jgi:hypothetical protein
MHAADPNPKPRRHLKPCRFCGASGAGCDSLSWLRGQSCCPRCTGEHEQETADAQA